MFSFFRKPNHRNHSRGMTVLVIPDSGGSRRLRVGWWWLAGIAVLGFAVGLGAFGAPILLAASLRANVSMLTTNARINAEKSDLQRQLNLSQARVLGLTKTAQKMAGRLNEIESRVISIETRAKIDRVQRASVRPGGGASNSEIDNPEEAFQVLEAELGVTDTNLERTLGPLERILRHEEAIPSGFPTSGRITSGFGTRIGPRSGRLEKHTGWDIATSLGSIVRATAPGVVDTAGWTNIGYGMHVIVNHGYGIKTLYGHLSKILVNRGREIQIGDVIGLVGSTGNSTGSHLHYEVRIDNQPINPGPYLYHQRYKPIGSGPLQP
jgi:murein DD-endopeptidase MepM/ murein hydrolase activator NlpD